MLAWVGGSTPSSSRSEQATADGSAGSMCVRCESLKLSTARCVMGSKSAEVPTELSNTRVVHDLCLGGLPRGVPMSRVERVGGTVASLLVAVVNKKRER